MNFETLPSLFGALSAGVAGVVLVVIGVPLGVAVLTRALIRAVRRRRWERAGIGLAVVLTIAALGAGLWSFAVSSAPGVLEEPLQMLAMTFLPFTVTFALLTLVAQRGEAKRLSRATSRRPLVHTATR